MAPAPAVQLIAQTDHNGKQQQMSAHAGKGIGQADNRIDQDADHNDDQQKTCAAAGVETGFDSHVFHRQRLSVLVTENRFMLGPVIGEQPLDLDILPSEVFRCSTCIQ